MPQIIRITSEAIQATIRRLLPSQQGFGLDLEATNVITPIIDLTPSAEGSVLPSYLQQAAAYGSNTAFSVNNSTSTITSTPGFWRILGSYYVEPRAAGVNSARIVINNGLSDNTILRFDTDFGAGGIGTELYDFILFLRAGDSLKVSSNSTNCNLHGSIRQLADVNGELINPSGFSFE